jgi:hypothetical protein
VTSRQRCSSRSATSTQAWSGSPSEGGTGFGSNAIKINSRSSRCWSTTVVVKLPAARVPQLISAAMGLPFDAGKGKP